MIILDLEYTATVRRWDKTYRRSRIFRRQNISGVKFSSGFIFVAMTTQPYKVTPFIRWRKYFFGLIFLVEGDRWKFLHDENFPIYGTCVHCNAKHMQTSKHHLMAVTWAIMHWTHKIPGKHVKLHVYCKWIKASLQKIPCSFYMPHNHGAWKK